MNEQKRAKIDLFLRDTAMTQSVYEALSESFSKDSTERAPDVLASERMAQILLQRAWKDLVKFKVDTNEQKPLNQVGY